MAGFRGMEEERVVAEERVNFVGAGKVVGGGERDGAREGHALTLVATKTVEATAEENARVAEVIELQRMAEGTGLDLAPEQWVALAEVTRRTQAVRGAVEVERAIGTEIAAGRWRMDVPGYADVGAAMRARFFWEIGEVLGAGVAVEVIDRLGPAFEGYFAGFGVSLQTLEIAAGAGEWVVTRAVAYAKEASGGEQVTVRRETYFAESDDPWVAVLREKMEKG